jgi:hypothetical protein
VTGTGSSWDTQDVNTTLEPWTRARVLVARLPCDTPARGTALCVGRGTCARTSSTVLRSLKLRTTLSFTRESRTDYSYE